MTRGKIPQNSAARHEPKWATLTVCLLLAAITLAVFAQTFGHNFIFYDDNEYVFDNPMVAQGLTLKGFKWAFTGFHAANWHPLTWLSHMLDCQIYGLRHPGGHHATSVLVHTASVIALFLILRKMTGAIWRSAFVAAIFAIHPLRAESVAWVAERKDVLSGFFFILTIGAYVRYARGPRSALRYGAVVLLFVAGLMCKPMLVTLPAILLLLDFWPLKRTESVLRLVLEKLPLFALSAGGCAVTLLAQARAMQSNEAYSVPLRLANATVAGMIYLIQMIWPANLVVFYPYPQNGLPPWEVALALIILVGISLAAWMTRKSRPWLLMGWVWYLVMILPVIGIIQVGGQAHADRYTYLPQIGLYIALTWLAVEWCAKLAVKRELITTLAAGIIVTLMICAWQQVSYWKDGETLWAHALACTTNNDEAYNCLGLAFREDGKLDDAIAAFQKAVEINPNCSDAHSNLGLVLLPKGRVDEAIDHCRKALAIRSDYKETHINLGNALVQKDRMDEAITEYREALHLDPDYAEAHNDLANALLAKGQVDEAINQYHIALEIKPDYADARYNLGIALQRKEAGAKALAPSR